MSRQLIPEEHFTDPRYVKLLYKAHIDLHNLLVDNNIAYWSSGGTTLGAIRHKGIIHWDNDVDLEISYNDVKYLMSKEFKTQLKKKGYGIRYHKESGSSDKYDWLKVYSFVKVDGNKADVDLFPVYFDKDNTGRMRTYYYSSFADEFWTKSFCYLDTSRVHLGA